MEFYYRYGGWKKCAYCDEHAQRVSEIYAHVQQQHSRQLTEEEGKILNTQEELRNLKSQLESLFDIFCEKAKLNKECIYCGEIEEPLDIGLFDPETQNGLEISVSSFEYGLDRIGEQKVICKWGKSLIHDIKQGSGDKEIISLFQTNKKHKKYEEKVIEEYKSLTEEEKKKYVEDFPHLKGFVEDEIVRMFKGL